MKAKYILLFCMLFLLLLSPCAKATPIQDVSALSLALSKTPYQDYTLHCASFFPKQDNTDYHTAYAIATTSDTAVLCAFVSEDDAWQLCVANPNALPDPQAQFSLWITSSVRPLLHIEAETATASTQIGFVIEVQKAFPADSWPLYEVIETIFNVSGKVLSITRIAPSEETGKWEHFENDEGKSYENHAYMCMVDFNVHTFPKTRAQADALWHGMGETVLIEPDDRMVFENLPKLVGQEIDLQGNTQIAVYSGPDASYLRSANGKAAVSPKEAVMVYATERDWALVSYRINAGERFGYIPLGYIPATALIPHELAPWSVGLTTCDVALLDNLSQPTSPLLMLSYQTPLEVYATMGDWLYVGCFSASGVSCRGFIPYNTFHHTNNF